MTGSKLAKVKLRVGIKIGVIDAGDRKHFHRKAPAMVPALLDRAAQYRRSGPIEDQAEDARKEPQGLGTSDYAIVVAQLLNPCHCSPGKRFPRSRLGREA